MKRIVLFLIILIFNQCQQQHIYILKKEEIKPDLTALQKRIDIKENFINIFFEANFNNERAVIQCDSKEVFSKNIITDNTINLADYYLQKSICKNLSINIGNQKIVLKKNIIEKYKYLYISKNNDKINLILSNSPHMYY
jgi:hypothetical protein